MLQLLAALPTGFFFVRRPGLQPRIRWPAVACGALSNV
jgi:hypothetical protein